MSGAAGRAGNIFSRRLFIKLLALALSLAPLEATWPAKGGGDSPPGFGKYKVVRINPDGIFPRVLRVERGATVIWFNATDSHSSVVFNEGDRLKRSTRSPTLFFLAPDGTYVSSAFGPGATSSTAFVKKGTFRYFVTGLPVSEDAAFAQIVVE